MVFQEKATVNLQSIPLCKNHNTSAENLINLIFYNSPIFDMVAGKSQMEVA